MKTEEKKQTVIKNALHEKDTGSAQVQVALLKTEINKLSKHLKANVKDIVSRRILLKKVAKEKKITKKIIKKNLKTNIVNAKKPR